MKGEAQKRQQQRAGAMSAESDTDTEFAEQQANQPELYVAATGAKISFASAKQRLYYFCDKLPSDRCVLAPTPAFANCQHDLATEWI